MKIFTAIVTVLYSMMGLANKVYAQEEWGGNKLDDINLGTNSLFSTITNLINIALGFLGIIAVVIILYGGFLWMTSAGNAERVQKAKLALISGVIGLAIIVSAYAIASFILKGLAESTGVSTGGTSGPPASVDPPPCHCGTALKICSISPMATGVGGAIDIRGCNFGTIAGDVIIDNGTDSVIGLPVSCDPSGEVYWKDTRIRVRIPESLPVANDYSVTVDLIGPAIFKFPEDTTLPPVFDHLAILAMAAPSIICLQPPAEAIGNPVDIQGAFFGSGTGADRIHIQSTGDELAHDSLDISLWSDTLITFNIPEDTVTGDIEVILDSGPTSNSSQLSVSCDDHGDCSTGCCWFDTAGGNNTCRDVDPYCLDGTEPRIIYMDPPFAGGDNLVTIQGVNFGEPAGPNSKVYFSDGGPLVEGVLPSALNASCSDFWTETNIIIGVPPALANIDTIQVHVQRDDTVNSNNYGFDKQAIDRPGVCGLSVPDGYYNDPVVVHGVSFNVGDEVEFGGIIDAGSSCGSAIQCNADVPNMVASGVSIQVTNATYDSNPYPFTILEDILGEPIINEMTPDSGPYGQYVTIIGSNFGDSQGQLTFNGNGINVLDDFPVQCQDNIWSNDTIIAKVPNWGAVDIMDVEVVVIRSGDGASNDVAEPENNFDYEAASIPTPGLCAIEPNNGPQGYSPVWLYGDNFQAFDITSSDVTFDDAQSTIAEGNIIAWESQSINVIVPNLAESGDVIVSVAATSSNPLTFNVGECETSPDNCSVAGEICCPTPGGDICLPSTQCDFGPKECEYTWEIRTVADPFRPIFDYCISPTPWPDDPTNLINLDVPDLGPMETREVYISANMSLFFNRNVYNADLEDEDNFLLYKCGTTNNFVNGDCDDAPGDELAGTSSVLSGGSDEEGLLFNPGADLEEGTWYKVIYGAGSNGFRAQIGGDIWTNGMSGTFDWHFKTRTNADVCYVDNVHITPEPTASNFMFDGSRTFSALPMAANCNICGNQYNWTYDTVVNGNELAVDRLESANPRNFGRVTLDSNSSNPAHFPTESLADPLILFTASVTNVEDATLITGYGTSTVLNPDFYEINHWPECGDSCANADVGITFSTPLLTGAGNINTINFEILDGAMNPLAIEPEIDGDWTVNINGGLTPIVFTAGETYTVNIDPFLEDRWHNTLDNVVTWQFTIGDQGLCLVDRVDIIPEDLDVNVGTTIDYRSGTYSAPGICYPSGQAINCASTPGCSWVGFDSSDDDVAEVLNVADGIVYASSSPAAPANTVVIENIANQGANSFSATTTLTVLPAPPPPVYAHPVVVPPVSPAPFSENVCINGMANIEFDLPMDMSSVASNFEFFFMNESDLAISGIDCFSAPDIGNMLVFPNVPDPDLDWLCTSNAWSVIAMSDREFVAHGLLVSDKHYLAGVFAEGTGIDLEGVPYTGVRSINNMPLENPGPWVSVDLDGDTNDDGYFWQFDVGSEECVPNKIEIFEYFSFEQDNYHMFTCADDDCPDDQDDPPNPNGLRSGNQKTYLALGFGINGIFVNIPSDDMDWTSLNGLLTIQKWPSDPDISIVDVWPTIPNPVDGRDFLDVNNAVLGLGDRVAVDVDICEVPWPDPVSTFDYYWNDTVGTSATNFSTRYCQSGGDGDEYLPLISYPWPSGPDDLNNPDADVLRDYLLIVDPNSIAMSTIESVPYDNFFGSLAFKGDALDRLRNEDKKSLSSRFVSLKDKLFDGNKADAAPAPMLLCGPEPPPPMNLQATIVGGTEVHLSWNYAAQHDYFRISRAELPNPALSLGNTTATTFVDTIEEGKVYKYYVYAYENECSPPNSIAAERLVGNPGIVDAIGVRVMKNPNNLSLEEWYRINAPNPSNMGTIVDVDGFRAMRVSNTIYIDGVNTTDSGDMYKNIYILSYNQEAAANTRNIFEQFIDNFELNANWDPLEKGTNYCNDDASVACSNDFDCMTGTCDSRSLKLKRDLVRLGDLFDIERYLYAYGINNMACPNNPEIGDGAVCPGGLAPVAYYPLLNEGSYVQGMTNTSWPSWMANNPHDLQVNLGESIGIDPINRFNGCPEGNEPDTCWSADLLEFTCEENSLLYMYKAENNGKNYSLGANFEYDLDAWPPSLANKVTFGDDLAGIGSVMTSLTLPGFCDSNTIVNPPGATGPYCGDGITQPDGADGIPSTLDDEECDGNFRDNICDTELTSYFGAQDWWNEMSAGCFMSGAVEECTFYEYIDDGGYTSSTLSNLCGGYCGDGELQDFYEQCENTAAGLVYDNAYTCDTGAVGCNNCQAMCGTLPAAICGDGILSATEECDDSASPDGLSGWDCSDGGTPICNTCTISCTAGDSYVGLCGNGILEGACNGPGACGDYYNQIACDGDATCAWLATEDCDFYGYEAPSPSETVSSSASGLSYACNNDCRYTGEYCGDGTQQYAYEELCDIAGYTAPAPENSHEFAQYACRSDYITGFTGSDGNDYYSCTPTEGGYCGDGFTDPAFGELCDTDWPSPLPENSSSTEQYGCASDCLSVDGGWCGDLIVNDGQTSLPRHGIAFTLPANVEQCDEGDYADRTYGVCDSVDCTWNCEDLDGDWKPDLGANVGNASLLFGGSSTVVLNPGDSTIMSLPPCRVSDNITLTMDVTTGIEIPETAIIFITDVSYSMGYCVAGWEAPVQPGGDWVCPERSPMYAIPAGYSDWSFYAVNGDVLRYNGTTWDNAIPTDDFEPIFQERIYATTLALKGNVVDDTSGSGAIERIFTRNSQAKVAMIEFAGSVVGATPFLNITDKGALNQRAHYIDDMASGTDHISPIQRARDMINDSIASTTVDYDNFVIIFMTDGECNTGHCEDTAIDTMDDIKTIVDAEGKELFVFGISLTNPYALAIEQQNIRGFVNGLTTNNCVPSFGPNGAWDSSVIATPGSTCGDGVVDCVNAAGVYEQCDGELTCDAVTCQWVADGNKRFYDYELEGGNLTNMYDYIAGIIPVAGVSFELDGISHYVEIPTSTLSVNVDIDMSYLGSSGRCTEFSGNYFNFRANFDGPEGTTVTLIDGEYNFCPWRNGGASSYY